MIHITPCPKVVQTDPRTDADDALIDLASGLTRGVDLDALLAEAAQQTRVDREYLLTPHQFREWIDSDNGSEFINAHLKRVTLTRLTEIMRYILLQLQVRAEIRATSTFSGQLNTRRLLSFNGLGGVRLADVPSVTPFPHVCCITPVDWGTIDAARVIVKDLLEPWNAPPGQPAGRSRALREPARG